MLRGYRPFTTSILMLVFLALPSGKAWAWSDQKLELKSGQQYPWSVLPKNCKDVGSKGRPECHFEDWPTHEETQSKLNLLYKTEQFQLLERAFAEISASKVIAESGWPLRTAIHSTVSNWFPTTDFDVEELARIGRWKKAVPESSFVFLAEACYLYNRAFSIRGGGYADTVSSESWKLFEKYLQDAERVLVEAPQKLRDHPAWYQAQILIALSMAAPKISALELFEEAISKWPGHFALFNGVVFRMQPKWGSSWSALESFASKWAAHYETHENDAGMLYARIYIIVRNEAAFDEMRPNWGKLKKGFETLTSRYPNYPNYKNYFASFACAARDKATFVAAMRLLTKDDLRPNAWIKGHSHEACSTWAYEKT